MNRKGFIKKILFVAVSTLSLQAQASGYKVDFQSVSVIGGGGEAAVVEDAGTNWFNAAGNVLLPQQSVFSIIEAYVPTTFTGTVNAPSVFQPFIGPSAFDYHATGRASSYPNVFLPAMHFVTPYKDRYAFGISVVPAWGLREDYGNDSVVRYNLIRVYTKTIDISPSLSMKLNNQWSVGLGPDAHYFSVASEQRVRTEGPPGTPFFGTPMDSTQRGTADKWRAGWHAGVLYQLSEKTRFGLSYRSKLIMHTKGYSDFTLNGSQNYESDDFEFRVPLPATYTLSGYTEVSDRWALTGTVACDQWSVLEAYTAENIISPPTSLGGQPVLQPTRLPQHMEDAWNFTVGTHYKWTDQWMLRSSFKYEQTPTVDHYRQVAFPDAPKYGFNFGSRYQMNKRMALDLVYLHVFMPEVEIHDVNPLTNAVAEGHQRSHADAVGAQIVMNI